MSTKFVIHSKRSAKFVVALKHGGYLLTTHAKATAMSEKAAKALASIFNARGGSTNTNWEAVPAMEGA